MVRWSRRGRMKQGDAALSFFAFPGDEVSFEPVVSKASALMLASEEIDGEGDFFVGEEVPAGAVEGVVFDAR